MTLPIRDGSSASQGWQPFGSFLQQVSEPKFHRTLGVSSEDEVSFPWNIPGVHVQQMQGLCGDLLAIDSWLQLSKLPMTSLISWNTFTIQNRHTAMRLFSAATCIQSERWNPRCLWHLTTSGKQRLPQRTLRSKLTFITISDIYIYIHTRLDSATESRVWRPKKPSSFYLAIACDYDWHTNDKAEYLDWESKSDRILLMLVRCPVSGLECWKTKFQRHRPLCQWT